MEFEITVPNRAVPPAFGWEREVLARYYPPWLGRSQTPDKERQDEVQKKAEQSKSKQSLFSQGSWNWL